MKPFNLMEALAGKPVVTRSGKPVTQVMYFSEATDKYPVAACVEGSVYRYGINGKFFSTGAWDHNSDLMMDTETKVGYINLYHDARGEGDVTVHTGLGIFSTREKALQAGIEAANTPITTLEITWEE